MRNVSLLLSALRCLAQTVALITALATGAFAQTPTPTPDQRGLGVQSAGAAGNSPADQQAREAKPELVLQTGYNNFFGATRLVFSPDGRLLATGTFRSSTIKLWETATGRELRNLSSGKQSAMGMSPAIAFSRDSRLVAAAAGENTVKVWDVTSGREVQTLVRAKAAWRRRLAEFTSSLSAQTIAWSQSATRSEFGTSRRAKSDAQFAGDNLNPLATDGWRRRRGVEPRWNPTRARFHRSEKTEVWFWDLATGRETRSVKLPSVEKGTRKRRIGIRVRTDTCSSPALSTSE